MAEDLHKDNLEDFFKDAFDKQTELPASDGWDVPSDQVWEKVDQAINSEDGRKRGLLWRRYWWMILLGVLLLTVGIVYFASNNGWKGQGAWELNRKTTNELPAENESDKLNQNKKETENQNKKIDSGSVGDNKSLLNPAPQTGSEISPVVDRDGNFSISGGATNIAVEKKNNSRKSTIPATTKSEPTGTSKIQTKEDVKLPAGINLLPGEADSNQQASKKKEIAGTDNVKEANPKPTSNEKAKPQTSEQPKVLIKELLSLPTIAQLATNERSMTDTFSLLTEPYVDLKKKTISTSPVGFYAGVFFGPVYTDRSIVVTGNPVIARLIRENEKGQFNIAAGLNLGYKISNHWSVETGLSYSKFSLEYMRRKQINYSTVGEQINDQGEFERSYDLSVETSGGDVDTDVALAREPGTSIPENDFINLRVRAQQNISYTNIPVVLKYHFGNGKVQIGMKAGVVNRFVLDGYMQLESVEVARSGLRLVVRDGLYRKRPLKNIDKYTADFLVGAGVRYQMNKKLFLSIEPTFTRSINPIFETNNFKTFPTTTSVDIGINYLF